jgi:outer membrane protein TolC
VLSLRTAQRSRDLAQGLVTENQRRFRVGSMSEYDVTAARAQAARREEFILIAERAVADQRTFLRSLISDERSVAALQEQLEVVEPPEIARPAGTSVADDFRQALDLRPDYQQARLAIQRGRYNRSFEMNQLLPEVNLVGSYGYHGFGSTWKESRERLQDRDRRSYTAGAVVRIPLTFTEGRGRHRAAKLEVLQAEAQIQQLEQAIMVRVSNAAGQIETARKRVAATRSARELAQQTLDAEIKLLRTATGATSTFVVLQYQEQLAAAEVAEFEARAAEQKAVAEYDRQIGTTLRTWRIQLDPPPAG